MQLIEDAQGRACRVTARVCACTGTLAERTHSCTCLKHNRTKTIKSIYPMFAPLPSSTEERI